MDAAKALNDRVGAAWDGLDSLGVSKMLGASLSCSRSQSMGASDERNSMRFIVGWSRWWDYAWSLLQVLRPELCFPSKLHVMKHSLLVATEKRIGD